MTYTINVTQQARHDMKTIYEYIALMLMEPEIAKKHYHNLDSASLAILRY